MAGAPEVAVVGAGIVGCALAAFLAEAGADVEVVEREEIAAGASGRNSGLIQHPMDPVLAPLYDESIRHYRDMAAFGFALPDAPGGLIVMAEAEERLAAEAAELRAAFPELKAELLAPGEPARLEPVLAPDLAGYRLEAGFAVPPAAATRAFAARARAADARFRGAEVASADDLQADVVVVAAGPRTPAVVDPTGAWAPIVPLWGVVAEVRLQAPPRHAVEESGIDWLDLGGAADPQLFSLITVEGASSLGSSFLCDEPDPRAVAPALRERGARYLPALASAEIGGVRACARPLSADGNPLLGRAPGSDRVFVAAGHGPWGVSLGPASARLVADLVLGREPAPPAAFAPERFVR